MKSLYHFISIFTILFFCINSQAQETLFYCNNSTGTFQVNSKNLETGTIEVISSNNDFNYWWAEPSPDGTELLLMRSPVGDGVDDMFDYDSCQMVKTNIDGSNEILLLDYNAYGWAAFGNPHWHPNGDRILMLAQPTNEFFIYTVDVDGTNPVQLTSQFSIDPHWSHSGDEIVFIGINPNPSPPLPSFDDFEVFKADYNYANNAMSNIQQLTDDIRRDQDPCFSPDDSQIAFSSATNVDLSIAHITVIDTDGNNRVDLVNDDMTNGGPVNWGSDNKIYYHHVNFNIPPFTPFTAKCFDVSSAMNTDIFPTITEGYISPFYFDKDAVGIDELNIGLEISIYPNPSKDIIFFEGIPNANIRIKIYDINAKLLDDFVLNDARTLNISNYPAGLYYYQLIGKEINYNGVVVKSE